MKNIIVLVLTLLASALAFRFAGSGKKLQNYAANQLTTPSFLQLSSLLA
jgi:hypothetical protein